MMDLVQQKPGLQSARVQLVLFGLIGLTALVLGVSGRVDDYVNTDQGFRPEWMVNGVAPRVEKGKGGPKAIALLVATGFFGLGVWASIEAGEEARRREIRRRVDREGLQQAQAIEWEVGLEAYQVIKEEQLLQQMSGGSVPMMQQPQALPQQQQVQPLPAAQGQVVQPQTVPAQTVPVQQVAQPMQQPQQVVQPEDKYGVRYEWVKDFENSGTILLCGGQGSGKTSKVKYLMNLYHQQGCEIWVIDPHAAYGQYPEWVSLHGGGMNFLEVNEAMTDFIDLIVRRYQKRFKQKDYDPLVNEKRVILFCEEMQEWSKQVDEKILGDFADKVLCSTRKANAGVIITAQADSVIQFLGRKAAAGNKDLVESSVAKLKGVPKVDPSVPGGLRPDNICHWKPSGSTEYQQVAYPDWIR